MATPSSVSRYQSSRRVWWLLLLAALPLLLAVWQWQRGEARSRQLQAFSRAANLPPRDLITVAVQEVPQGQRVWLQARASRPPLLVAGALQGGRDGVRTWQAVALHDGSWVVVDRGWLPRPAASVVQPLLAGRLAGHWVARPAPYLLSGARVGITGEVDALDWPTLAASLPGPLRPGLVLLSPTQRPYLAWPARPGFDPQRHYAYALQWLLLAVCVLLAVIVMARRGHENTQKP